MKPIVKWMLIAILVNSLVNVIIIKKFSAFQENKYELFKSENTFVIPKIIQKNNTGSWKLLEMNHINVASTYFYGKYKFSDSIRLQLEPDTSLYKDFVDVHYNKDSTDKIPSDGLQLFTDFKIIIPPKYPNYDSSLYYSVYIVNETKSTKLLHGKDDHLFAIQEARDSNGDWRPIEIRGFDFCGMGKWALKIHSGEFVALAMPKYTGTYQTELRVRLKNGDAIILSKPFKGQINYNQFRFSRDDMMYKFAKKYPLECKSFNFYDAAPLDFEIFLK